MSTLNQGLARDHGTAQFGRVIPFPSRRPPDNRLCPRDRIALLEWLEAARNDGVARYTLEDWETGDDPQIVGNFAMIYREGFEWATWSLARSGRNYQVWETAYGQTLGVFATIAAALGLISREAAALKISYASPGQPRRRSGGRSRVVARWFSEDGGVPQPGGRMS